MQHESQAFALVSSTPALEDALFAGPQVLDEELLSLVSGAGIDDGPHDNW